MPVLTAWLALSGLAGQAPAAEPQPYEQQVVVETTQGDFVLEVFPSAAPEHVRRFLERVENGSYVGTAFHRAIPMGIIQGGDPLTKDLGAADRYGTGGLGELAWHESPLSHTRGALSAVLLPDERDSAGSQFFVCVTPQPQLDGQYTVYGRVVEGFSTLEEISRLGDAAGAMSRRVEVTATRLRTRPPPRRIPFADASPAEMAVSRVVVTTDLGEFEIELAPDKAPEHVRQFLKFAALGLYDGTLIHRVVPGFVIQGGSIANREPPVEDADRALIVNLEPEFNDIAHVRGTVSMARAEALDSAVDSFFVVLDTQSHLDGRYTAFGRVTRGLEVLDAISFVPTAGESPVKPLRIRVRVREP